MCGAPSLFITHNLNLVLESQASYKNFNGTTRYSIGEGLQAKVTYFESRWVHINLALTHSKSQDWWEVKIYKRSKYHAKYSTCQQKVLNLTNITHKKLQTSHDLPKHACKDSKHDDKSLTQKHMIQICNKVEHLSLPWKSGIGSDWAREREELAGNRKRGRGERERGGRSSEQGRNREWLS